jgi:hypothetical protein
LPELRLDIQLVHTLNQATDIVDQDLAQCLIHLRRVRLASEAVAKLLLDHTERGFHVTAFVVLLKEPFLIERKVVVHLPP